MLHITFPNMRIPLTSTLTTLQTNVEARMAIRTRPALAPTHVHILTPACTACLYRPPVAAVTVAIVATVAPPPRMTSTRILKS